jgi:uncharacterized membrane protein
VRPRARLGDTAVINSPTGAVSVDSNATVGALIQSAGTLTGDATLTINGLFTWTHGTQSGDGLTQANGGMLISNIGVNKIANRSFNVPAGQIVTMTGQDSLSSAQVDRVGGNHPQADRQTAVFTNSTTGDGPLSYEWDFGDGSPIVTSANPTHVYTAVGSYTVTLTAANAAGSDIYQATFVVQGEQEPPLRVYLPLIVR